MLEVGWGGCSEEMVSNEGPELGDMAGKLRCRQYRGGSWGSPGDLQFWLQNPFQDQVSPGRNGPGARREGAIEDGGGAAEEGSEEPKGSGESPLPFPAPSSPSLLVLMELELEGGSDGQWGGGTSLGQ